MVTKFSQFLNGVTPRTTDIVVGLRGYPSNPLNEKFDFTGVADTDGNNIVTWSSSGALSVNYIDIKNSLTTLAPTIVSKGADSVVNLNIGGKGNSSYTQFLGTRAIAIPSGTTAQEGGAIVGGLRYDSDTDYIRYWNVSENQWVDIINGSAYADATFITKTNETADLPNSVPLSGLATGFLSNTTATGVLNPRSMASASSQRIVITNADGSAGNPLFDLATTAVTPGSYTTADITVDAYGRITAAENGSNVAIGVGITVTQPSHGFSVGQALYFNGSNYVLALADNVLTAEVIGVVLEVVNVNTFIYISVGLVSGLSGLTPGNVGWLSDVTPGLITDTIPVDPGAITKPVWIAISSTDAMVYQERGKIIPNPSFQAFGFLEATTNTTIEAATGYYTGGTGTITYTMPLAAAQGDYYVISGGANTTGWVLQMAGSQVLKIGNQVTTAGGTLSSTLPTDSVNVVCVDTNLFMAYAGTIGNLTTA